MKTKFLKRWIAYSLTLAVPALLTGCQVDIGGQTLPSGYYIKDGIQYHSKGPDFKLANEAAAMKEAEAEQALLGN